MTFQSSSRERSPVFWNEWGSQRFASADRIANTVTPDGRGTTVPFHPGRDLSPALLRVIARDIGMDVRDFIARRWNVERSGVERPGASADRCDALLADVYG